MTGKRISPPERERTTRHKRESSTRRPRERRIEEVWNGLPSSDRRANAYRVYREGRKSFQRPLSGSLNGPTALAATRLKGPAEKRAATWSRGGADFFTLPSVMDPASAANRNCVIASTRARAGRRVRASGCGTLRGTLSGGVAGMSTGSKAFSSPTGGEAPTGTRHARAKHVHGSAHMLDETIRTAPLHRQPREVGLPSWTHRPPQTHVGRSSRANKPW